MTSFRLKKPTLSSIPRTILFFGGSRGVGYHALRCLLHLHPDLRCLLFLRDAEAFRKSTEGDDLFRYLKQRDMQDRVRLFKGNVLDLRAVQAVLAHAGEELSAVIYAIGTMSTPERNSLTWEMTDASLRGCRSYCLQWLLEWCESLRG